MGHRPGPAHLAPRPTPTHGAYPAPPNPHPASPNAHPASTGAFPSIAGGAHAGEHTTTYDVTVEIPRPYRPPLAAAGYTAGPRQRRRKAAIIVAVIVVALAAAVGAVLTLLNHGEKRSLSAAATDLPTRLESAAQECGVEGVIGDDGRTLTLDRIAAEEFPSSITYYEYDCILTELETPESIRSQMGSTRALDGMQTNSWDDLTATWTYHPDDGIWITITED